jgi:hypothetical protein
MRIASSYVVRREPRIDDDHLRAGFACSMCSIDTARLGRVAADVHLGELHVVVRLVIAP